MSQTTFAFFSFFVAPTLNSPNFFSNKIKKWKKIIHFYSNRDKKNVEINTWFDDVHKSKSNVNLTRESVSHKDRS